VNLRLPERKISRKLKKKKRSLKQRVVVYFYNSSLQRTEAGGYGA
jgi:hypothetical protein